MILRSVAMTLTLPLALACSSDGSSKLGQTNEDGGHANTSSGGATNTPATDAGGTAKIGEPCPNGVSDCTKGLGCDGDDPQGGQCFGICAPHQDSDCGDTNKFACNVEGHCYLRCNTNTDCPRYSEGYVCKDDTPVRAGIKFCDVPD